MNHRGGGGDTMGGGGGGVRPCWRIYWGWGPLLSESLSILGFRQVSHVPGKAPGAGPEAGWPKGPARAPFFTHFFRPYRAIDCYRYI